MGRKYFNTEGHGGAEATEKKKCFSFGFLRALRASVALCVNPAPRDTQPRFERFLTVGVFIEYIPRVPAAPCQAA